MPARAQNNSTAYPYLEESLLKGLTPITASGTSVFTGFGRVRQARFLLKCGTVAGTTPNLALKLEESLDLGVTWNSTPILSFTAITASNPAAQYVTWTTPLADWMRVNWTVTGTTPSFSNLVLICASWAWDV